MFLLEIIFCLFGTFTIHGDLVVHWNEVGVPNNSTGKWFLWAMLLMAFLSMFTHSSFSKKRPGQNSLSMEMSGAFSTALLSTWSITNIILVTYYCYYGFNSYCFLLYFISYNCLYSEQKKQQILICKGDDFVKKLSEDAEKIMAERFGKDTIIALATVENEVPFVRYVNAYYEKGAFYIITYALSNKMRHMESNSTVAIAGEWFTAHGKSISIF